jgi:hypothetical protein
VFENRMLRRILRPKWEEVAGSWRKLHNEELHNLFPPPCIIKAIKSRRMIWVEYVACICKRRNAYKILVGKPEERRLTRKI